METLQVTIRNPKAKALLQDLADMELIEIAAASGQVEKYPNRYFGCGKDIIKTIHPSFDDPLDEFKEYE